jgi:hypothetical protein
MVFKGEQEKLILDDDTIAPSFGVRNLPVMKISGAS